MGIGTHMVPYNTIQLILHLLYVFLAQLLIFILSFFVLFLGFVLTFPLSMLVYYYLVLSILSTIQLNVQYITYNNQFNTLSAPRRWDSA